MRKNCPEEYYEQCDNAIFKCTLCRAGVGKSKNRLYFKTTNPAYPITKHPAYKVEVNKKIQKVVRAGLNEETKIVKSLIHKTVRSGAIYGDGDIQVNQLKLDSKKRTNTRSFTISPDEYSKGLRSNLDGWVVTNSDGNRVYVLTEKAFVKLIGENIC